MKSRGRCASAAQIATRCCWPPESSAGSASRRSSRPTRSSKSVGDALALAALDTEQREPERDELARGQLRRERAGVVLVGVAERARPVLDEPAAAQRAQIVAEDAHRARRRPVEPGEDAQQRALAGAARPEDDEQLAERDVERQALQRDRRSLRRRVEPEEIARLDGVHRSLRAVAVASDRRRDDERREHERRRAASRT